jgi:hypothetical protein
MRVYVPAASRTVSMAHGPTASGNLIPSSTYIASIYYKISGKGGSGDLLQTNFSDQVAGALISDAAEVAWTRKTVARPTAAGARQFLVQLLVNPASTATGTGWFSLPQLEQGSAATAWRNAPSDDAPLIGHPDLTNVVNDQPTFANVYATFADFDPRDAAINMFLPWDATVIAEVSGLSWTNSGANEMYARIEVDGAAISEYGTNAIQTRESLGAAGFRVVSLRYKVRLAAGKHRFALRVAVAAGTMTSNRGQYMPHLIVTATRGK